MKISREDKKAEAIKRMKKIGLSKGAIDAFEKEDEVMVSEFDGILYDFSSDSYSDAVKKAAEDFEKEYDGLIYFIIQTHTTLGTMYAMFYVSDHKSEWEMDNSDLKEKATLAYVYNESDPILSELGMICFAPINGGAIRTE